MEGNFAPDQNKIKSAEMEIMSIRDHVALLGANDHEIPELNLLVDQLKRGEISPEEALKKAHSIMAYKQDYH